MMYRDRFKKYLYRKLKNLTINEKHELLTEIRIATEEVTSEINSHSVYCATCKKHFLKTNCKERILETKEFVQDDDRDDSMFSKGTTLLKINL